MKSFFGFLLLGAALITDLTAQSGNVHYGPTSIQNQTLDDLTIYGTAQVIDSKINNLAIFKGPVTATRTTFKQVRVDGLAKFDDVTVRDELYINGPINARGSTFKSISIASSELALSACKVDKLFVRKNDNPLPQRVYLDNGTSVQKIEFETKGGTVVLGDSTVVVGEIVNGISQKQKN